MEKKIGIITVHRALNKGAVLQAYALHKYLLSTGFTVEVIDYFPSWLKRVWNKINKNPLKILIRYKEKPAFKDFVCNNFTLSKQYNSLDELKKDPPIYDKYICGSDQLWNYDITGEDWGAFFLEFVPNDYDRIAYAISMGGKPFRQIHEPYITEQLKKFSSIMAREPLVQQEVSRLTGKKNIPMVVDPSLLLSKTDYEFCFTKNRYNEKCIVVIDLEGSDLLKRCAKYLQKKTGYRIVNISGAYLSYAKNPLSVGPKEWLNWIWNANCVLTNSFHGLAYSIILERHFFCINRLVEDKNNRLINLLAQTGLENRMIYHEDNLDALSAIDYQNVNKKMYRIIEESRNLLLASLYD